MAFHGEGGQLLSVARDFHPFVGNDITSRRFRSGFGQIVQIRRIAKVHTDGTVGVRTAGHRYAFLDLDVIQQILRGVVHVDGQEELLGKRVIFLAPINRVATLCDVLDVVVEVVKHLVLHFAVRIVGHERETLPFTGHHPVLLVLPAVVILRSVLRHPRCFQVLNTNGQGGLDFRLPRS